MIHAYYDKHETGRYQEGVQHGTAYMRSPANEMTTKYGNRRTNRRRPIHKLKKASGLLWIDCGTVAPVFGKELDNPELAEALAKGEQGVTHFFEPWEWERFGVPDNELSLSHIIKVGQNWFKPSSCGKAGSATVRAGAEPLKLRTGPELDSLECGSVHPQTKDLVMVSERVLDDGRVRAHIYKDETPRGIAAKPLGWVTIKKGEEQLVQRGELQQTTSLGLALSDLAIATSLAGSIAGSPPGSARYSLSPSPRMSFSPRSVRDRSPRSPHSPSSPSKASRIAQNRLERLAKRAEKVFGMGGQYDADSDDDASERDGFREGPIEDNLHLRLGVRLMQKYPELSRHKKIEQLMRQSDTGIVDGKLDKSEFMKFMKELLNEEELKQYRAEVEDLFNVFDLDGDQTISYYEFETACNILLDDVGYVSFERAAKFAERMDKFAERLEEIYKSLGVSSPEAANPVKVLRRLRNPNASDADDENVSGNVSEVMTEATQRAQRTTASERNQLIQQYTNERKKLVRMIHGRTTSHLGVVLKSLNVNVDKLLVYWGGIPGMDWDEDKNCVASASSGEASALLKPEDFKDAFVRGVQEVAPNAVEFCEERFVDYLFDIFDTDGSGELDIGEINRAMRVLLKSKDVHSSRAAETQISAQEKIVNHCLEKAREKIEQSRALGMR